MPYVNFGGFGATENIIGFTGFKITRDVKRVLEPNLDGYHQPNHQIMAPLLIDEKKT